MSTATHQRRFVKSVVCKAADGEPAGTFDTIVSVFGNIDYHGDRMVLGAFEEGNLPEWRDSGDPIPVIFTHRWDDLLAHIGTAAPAEVYELAPGDSSLPASLKANGGLYARQRLDVDADPAASYAGRVAELLERRSLREFSFAFDPLAIRPVDGVDEIVRVALWEIGPTLLGANPLTELLAAKARELGVTPKALDSAFTDLLGRSVLIDTKATLKDEEPEDDDEDPSAEEDLELEDVLVALEEAGTEEGDDVGQEDESDEDEEDEDPDDEGLEDNEEEGSTVSTSTKAITVTPGGSIEERLGRIFDSAAAWAALEYGGDLFAVHLEGTYLEDGYAIVVAERWEDPWDEGPVWRLDFTEDERGAVTITESVEVAFEGDFVSVRTEPTESAAKALAALEAKTSTMSDGGAATLADVKASGKAGPDGEAEDHGAEGDNLIPADVEELLTELEVAGSE